jgi:hypothetical protein
MIRKFLLLAALVLTLGVTAPRSAPAIDFFCRCDLCAAHPGVACIDLNGGGRQACGTWYSTHC